MRLVTLLLALIANRSIAATVIVQDVAVIDGSVLGIAHAGANDPRLFAMTRDGRVHVILNGQVSASPFLDISERVGQVGEQGLLGIAFDPEYFNSGSPRAGLFYLHYSERNSGDSIVSSFAVSATDPNQALEHSEQVILRVEQPHHNHNGGTIAFGPDGYFYVFLGDGGMGNDSAGLTNNAQRLENLLGSIVRLDLTSAGRQAGASPPCGAAIHYSIPADNPFVNTLDACPEIWAYGFRNPFQSSIDAVTGDIWVGDVGQGHYEEINLVPGNSAGGQNFGWSCRQGSMAHPTNMHCTSPGPFMDPLMELAHPDRPALLIAIIGGLVYRGPVQALAGDYFFAELFSQTIYQAADIGGGAWDYRPVAELNVSPVAFGVGADGKAYVGSLQGSIMELTVDEVFHSRFER